jgi:hypothetical protein
VRGLCQHCGPINSAIHVRLRKIAAGLCPLELGHIMTVAILRTKGREEKQVHGQGNRGGVVLCVAIGMIAAEPQVESGCD